MEKQGPLSGQTLGEKYLLGELLGEGGFGVVYHGHHLLLDRHQAIKVPHEQYFRKPKFRERFLREAKIVATLDHPHIMHIDDFGMDEQEAKAYLVMPFIGGGTFSEILKGQRESLSVEQVVLYLEQVCRALDYAHQRGVIHLDLKPSNLLIDEGGGLLLADFGLAHFLNQGVVEGGTSLGFGSPHYMAPEHIKGQPNKFSDVYALGIMLFEMLVGQRPFTGETPEAIMVKHLTEPPPLLQSLRPELPIELEEVLERALAKQAEQRFRSPIALLNAFKGALTRVQEQVLKAEQERLWKVEEEQARKAEEERLQRVKEEQALRAQIERLRKAEEEQARKAEEERLQRVKEEQSLRAQIERLQKAKDEQIRKAAEERLQRAQEEQALRAQIEHLQRAEQERARKTEKEQLQRVETPESPQGSTILDEEDEKVEERPFRLSRRPYGIHLRGNHPAPLPTSRQTFKGEGEQPSDFPEYSAPIHVPQPIPLSMLLASPKGVPPIIDSPTLLPLSPEEPTPVAAPVSGRLLVEATVTVKLLIRIVKSLDTCLVVPWLLCRLWWLCQKPGTGRLARFWFDNSKMLTLSDRLIPPALKGRIQFACAFHNAHQEAIEASTSEEAKKILLAVIDMEQNKKYSPTLTPYEKLRLQLAIQHIHLPSPKVRHSPEQAKMLIEEELRIRERLADLAEQKNARKLAAFWLENYVVLTLIGRQSIGSYKWDQMQTAYNFREACRKAEIVHKNSPDSIMAEIAIVKVSNESHSRGDLLYFTRKENNRIKTARERLQLLSEINEFDNQ